jgi:hypothetical protein
MPYGIPDSSRVIRYRRRARVAGEALLSEKFHPASTGEDCTGAAGDRRRCHEGGFVGKLAWRDRGTAASRKVVPSSSGVSQSSRAHASRTVRCCAALADLSRPSRKFVPLRRARAWDNVLMPFVRIDLRQGKTPSIDARSETWCTERWSKASRCRSTTATSRRVSETRAIAATAADPPTCRDI